MVVPNAGGESRDTVREATQRIQCGYLRKNEEGAVSRKHGRALLPRSVTEHPLTVLAVRRVRQ